MDELVKQVQLMSETLATVVQRQEQIFKLQEERLTAFLERAESLKQTQERLETSNQALLQSLNESDRQIDDLAKVTAALLKVQLSLEKQAANAA